MHRYALLLLLFVTNRLWCFIGLPSDGQNNWNGRGVANNLVPPGPPLSATQFICCLSASCLISVWLSAPCFIAVSQ